ncbi:MAG: CapA family protein, partial [Chloroflexota bacterium]
MDPPYWQRDGLWAALLAGLALLGVLLIAVSFVESPALLGPTPTPTVATPSPTPSPTPTPVPSPTPTPELPATVGCGAAVPEAACEPLRQAVAADPDSLAWVDEAALADLQLRADPLPDSRPFATWIYALVAPFYTLDDGVAAADLRAAWGGENGGPLAGRPLLISPNTQGALPLGEPGGGVQTVEASELLTRAVELDAWAIVPFHELEPRWKVLRIDGVSPLDGGFDAATYPLTTTLHLGAESRSDVLPLLPAGLTNRDPEKMTVLMMTGVTALARGTAVVMEREGVTFPGRDIREWMTEPDITHTSNEVSFAEDCPSPTGEPTVVFCSDPRYFELLEYVEIDVLELTGNHLLDWGVGAMENSLRIYEEHGM